MSPDDRIGYLVLQKLVQQPNSIAQEDAANLQKAADYWNKTLKDDIVETGVSGKTMSARYPAQLQFTASDLRSLSTLSPTAFVPFSVFLKHHTLKANKSISLCFFDGTDQSAELISAVFSEFEPLTGRTFVATNPAGTPRRCGGSVTALIRIKFNTSGWWSQVGSFATKDQSKATMGLEGMGDLSSLSSEFRGVVRHEIMHALGFEHEQQSPNSNCWQGINFQKIADFYGSPWTSQMAKENFDLVTKFYSPGEIQASEYDPASRLHYQVFPQFYDNNQVPAGCVPFGGGDALSAQDIKALKTAYEVP
jgi:hypothetical protein